MTPHLFIVDVVLVVCFSRLYNSAELIIVLAYRATSQHGPLGWFFPSTPRALAGQCHVLGLHRPSMAHDMTRSRLESTHNALTQQEGGFHKKIVKSGKEGERGN